MTPNPELDQILRDVDAEQIAKRQPVLSAIVLDDDTGLPCHIFWESVEKYRLRLPGETDEQVAKRLIEAAFSFQHYLQ